MIQFLTPLVLVFLAASGSLAQPVFRIDSLPSQGVLLDTGWKWHAGDNLAWAKPEFDDSKWEAINPAQDIHDLPQLRKAQIGWFRLKLQVDSTLLQQALALAVWQAGASEIYLDGRLIYRLGVVSSVPEQEQTANLKGEVYSFHLNGKGIHQLAIRYSFTTANFYNDIVGFGNPCLALHIQTSNQAYSDHLYINLIPFVLDFVLAALYLLLGVTFLFFYSSFNTRKPYLFFGLFAIGHFIAYSLYILRIRPVSTSFDALCTLGACIVTYSGVLFLLVGAYALYGRPRSWFFYGLVGYAVLSLPAMLLFYKGAWMVNSGFYLIFNLDQLRQYWYSMKTRQAGARTLFGSILIFYVFFLLSLSLKFAGQGGLGYVSISIGLFFVPIGYSLFLAGEFARTAHTLRKRVVEVEELSAENQQILTKQNETLEHQVAERTTALNQSLTDLRTTQTQLIQKEKMASLGELTAGIAHEIQNPLNFVNNFSEVSVELIDEQKEALGKGDTQEAQAIADDLIQNLQKISLHGQRASSIVKGMLEHSRTSTGERQPTDLNALADEYLRLAYQGFRAKDKTFNCELVTHFDSALPSVDIVPQEIGRVLLNLYNNAFYAVGQRVSAVEEGETYVPTVWVSTHQSANAVEIRVRDNGTGIPDSVKTKIFQPFFTTKPTGEGTGLGLSLSYDIVTKGHGGTLNLASEPGQFTEFIITLPFA